MMKDKGCTASSIGYYLVLVGAINWGLVGIGYFINMDLNVVHMLLGSWMSVEAIVYVLVGISGVVTLVGCKCKTCTAARAEMGLGTDAKPMP